MKKVAILGSTGSIGTQTLDVVRANADLEVVGLAAGSNVEMLEKQIREFHPKLVAVWKEEAARDLAVRVQDLDVKIVTGMDGLIEVSDRTCENAGIGYSGHSYRGNDRNQTYHGSNPCRQGHCTGK